MQPANLLQRGAANRLGRAIWASGLLVPLIFILVVVCFAPIRDHRELDGDEGVNLMKALLVYKGHALYTEIWSDQPPLLTLGLAQWFRWFGTSVMASRFLILLLSALLLWAFYQTVRLAVSEPAALSGVALLVLSNYYIRLSISVMIGLPAAALAMLSLYMLVVGQRTGRSWLTVASGIVFALSMQIKLVTALLVPVILIYLCFLNETGTSQPLVPRQRLRKCALWLGATGAVFVVIGIVFRSFDPQQLIIPHFGVQTRTAFRAGSNLAFVSERLSVHIGYLPLACVGAFWGLKRRIPTAFLALGWLACAFAFLLYQEPLWYHHFLMIMVPLAWLCAFGVEAGLRAFGLADRAQRLPGSGGLRYLASPLGTLVVGALVIFNLVSRGHLLPHELKFTRYNGRIVDRLCPEGRSKPAWVFSDRPIYAFQAGLVMPPPTAVISRKRLVSGQLTEDMLLDILRTYRPEYVVLERRFADFSQEFRQALGEGYALLEEYYDHDKLEGQLLGAQPVQAGQFAGTLQTTTIIFDDWLSLEWAPALLDDQVEAGSCLKIPGLTWQRLETQAAQDAAISLRLTDTGGNILAQYDEPLGTDYNTMRDRARMPYFLDFLIPDGTPPGNYDLRLVVYDPQTGRPLEATGGAAAAGGGAVLKQVRVDRPAEALALRSAVADFGPVRLITADTPATAVSPGDEMPLTMLWQADADHHGESFVVVSQLLNDQGKVAAGLEEEPLDGRYGTASWQPGELVRDHHVLSIPADTPPGQYDLVVGLYRLPTRERLRTPSGLLGLRPHDYFLLRQIEVR